MKKRFFTTLAAFLALTLVACSPANEDASNEPGGDATSQEAQTSQSVPTTSAHTKHTWGDWTINQPKPCEEGTKTRTCTVCGEVDTQKVPAGDHTFGALQVTTPATCGEGVAKRVCSACGKEESIAILPTQDHSWAAATVEHAAEAGEVTETYETCGSCNQTRISWNAQDANKEASSGFNSSGKFGAAGDYVVYKFYSPKALKARLYVKIANRSGSSDSPYDRAAKTGNQSIWYDYYNGPEFKYTVTVNEGVINQNAQADVLIGEEVVPMSEYMYSDFLPEGANELVAPWFTFETQAGLNTLRIERTLGYSVSVKEFYVIGA